MTERITAEQVHGWAECLFSISREDGGLEDFYPQEMANDLDRLSRQLAQDEQRIAGFQSDAQQLNNALEDERCARAVVAAKSGRAEARIAELEAWKEAVVEASVVNWTLSSENKNNPRKAVDNLIRCIYREDLDPRISQVAHDLVEAKEQAEARCKALEHQLADCYRATGADPDGNSDAALAPFALAEVKRLRTESEQEATALAHAHAEAEKRIDEAYRLVLVKAEKRTEQAESTRDAAQAESTRNVEARRTLVEAERDEYSRAANEARTSGTIAAEDQLRRR